MSTRAVVVVATFVASLAFAVSLVTSATVASRAYVRRGEEEKKRESTLEVTGSAKSRIVSDLALWKIRVSGEARTQEEAFSRLATASDQVREFLGKRGFTDAEVAPEAISTETHFKRDEKGQETREIVSFVLSRSYGIRTASVDRVAQAAGDVTELLKTGALVESFAPDYVYTKLADLKVRMIGEATANARVRAETIASGGGCRLGEVREAGAGPLQITPPWSTDVSSGGVNDTSTIEKDVTSVVHLVFAIDHD